MMVSYEEVSSDDVSCSLLDVYQRCRGAYCPHHHGDHLMMEVLSTSGTSINLHQTTWCNIPENNIPIISCLSLVKILWSKALPYNLPAQQFKNYHKQFI